MKVNDIYIVVFNSDIEKTTYVNVSGKIENLEAVIKKYRIIDQRSVYIYSSELNRISSDNYKSFSNGMEKTYNFKVFNFNGIEFSGIYTNSIITNLMLNYS